MPAWKCTTLFEAKNQGWSETWYLNTSLTATQVMDKLRLICPSRAKLLGFGCSIIALRVSDDAVRGDSELYVPAPGEFPPFAVVRDNPTNAIYCKVTSGQLYRRQLWLRGVPDVWIAWDNTLGTYTVDPLFNTNLGIFKLALINEGFQLRALNKNLNINNQRAIIDIVDGPAGFTTYNVPAHGYTVGQEIRIANVVDRLLKPLQGTTRVKSVGGVAEFTTYQPWRAYYADQYTGSAKVITRYLDYPVITNVVYVRPGSRRVGRTFFAPRGRRSNRL
jgi:hypothetical protein